MVNYRNWCNPWIPVIMCEFHENYFPQVLATNISIPNFLTNIARLLHYFPQDFPQPILACFCIYMKCNYDFWI
jgi:hypothetical protein